jgi:hypothetical protein
VGFAAAHRMGVGWLVAPTWKPLIRRVKSSASPASEWLAPWSFRYCWIKRVGSTLVHRGGVSPDGYGIGSPTVQEVGSCPTISSRARPGSSTKALFAITIGFPWSVASVTIIGMRVSRTACTTIPP